MGQLHIVSCLSSTRHHTSEQGKGEHRTGIQTLNSAECS